MLAAEQTSLEQLSGNKGGKGAKNIGLMEFDMNEVMVGGRAKATGSAQANQEDEENFEDRFGAGALDEGMGLIKRKTIVVRSENVGEVFMQNIA